MCVCAYTCKYRSFIGLVAAVNISAMRVRTTYHNTVCCYALYFCVGIWYIIYYIGTTTVIGSCPTSARALGAAVRFVKNIAHVTCEHYRNARVPIIILTLCRLTRLSKNPK